MILFTTALQLTTLGLGLAIVQQCCEHLRAARAERLLFSLRFAAAALLITGLQPLLALGLLLVLGSLSLLRFNGPYNGGSDRVTLLITLCLFAAYLAPRLALQKLAFGYLALQITYSYFQSGWVKVTNPAWRSGQALVDVFAYTAYPVSEHTRRFAQNPQLLQVMAWAVFGFELLFPLTWLHPAAMVTGLIIAGSFHLANACLFGLNRFFWIWLCAYPALLWWQGEWLVFVRGF